MVYPNGPNHLPLVGTIHDTGKGLLLPKRQHGPRLFGIECDRKQEKYKLLKPSKGERKKMAQRTHPTEGVGPYIRRRTKPFGRHRQMTRPNIPPNRML